jgi:signal transduction histidine kinase
MGTFFGGRKVGLLFGGLALVISGAFYGLDLAGLEIASSIPEGRGQGLHIITATLLLAMVTFISFTVDRTKELAFAALEHEVREREEAVNSLRASEGKLAQAQHVAHLGCWELDLVRGSGWWSDEHYRMLGMERGVDDFSVKMGLSLIDLEDRERVVQVVEEAVRAGHSYRVEFKVTLPNGERRYHSSVGKPQLDEEGRATLLTGATQDVTESKLLELEKDSLQKQLLRASHQAGMAEVATGLLQNMGNSLSNLKTTTFIMEEALQDFRIEGVSKASAMIEENQTDLARFFSEDQHGSRFANYFSMLAEHMEERHALVTQQIQDMKRSLTQVDTIVGSQQDYASCCSVSEEVLAQELLAEALRINENEIDLHGVRIESRVQDSPKLVTDRHRLLQILVVLIKNAVEAVSPMEEANRLIFVGMRSAGPDEIVIDIEDNGVGVAEEDNTRIFAFGYTTKPEQDGVGLHTAALAAEMLGGSLGVSSEGLGRGATFTLILPRNYTLVDQKAKLALN